MPAQPITVLAPAASAWTMLYVLSKVYYAVTGTLGVTGGPVVPLARYAAYAPGEVAAAQWANAGLGLLAAGLLLGATRFPAGWNRWLLTVPMATVFLSATAGALGMVARDLLTGSGGAVFGAWCAVWAVLVGAATRAHHRSREQVPAADQVIGCATPVGASRRTPGPPRRRPR